eukprot:Transcript_20505.p2 GENE.Transcript_20505~~Transcript_20505.p2  ORF type:complete len:180 (-),score=39.13 Transcript_20505:117-656(-)
MPASRPSECFEQSPGPPRTAPDSARLRAASGSCAGPGALASERRRGVSTVPYAWSLGYLMSYVRMGRVRGECVRGGACACGARVFDAHWKREVSVPHISRLMLKYKFARRAAAHDDLEPGPWAARAGSELQCPCTIRLTVLNETSSGEHKFKLVALMSGFYTGTIVGDAVSWAANFGIM